MFKSVTLFVSTLIFIALSTSFSTVVFADVRTLHLSPTDDINDRVDLGDILAVSKWEHAYFRFDVSDVTGVVTNATFRVFNLADRAPMTMYVGGIEDDNWSEQTAPPRRAYIHKNPELALDSVETTQRQYIEFNVTDFVRPQVEVDGAVTLELTSNEDSWDRLFSRESDNPPELIIVSEVDGGVDTTAPIITLTGANPQIIELGAAYTELGAGTDDGSDVVIDATAVNTAEPGNYTVTYNAVDGSGNVALEVTRLITVNEAEDTTAPIITLTGANPQIIELGAAYTELGAGTDDGSDVVIDATAVNTAEPGNYTVTYNAVDGSGNVALEVTRTVTVEDNNAVTDAPLFVNKEDTLLTIDVEIEPIVFLNIGGVELTSCTATGLPVGLAVAVSEDANTCIITGTPTVVQRERDVIVRATNAIGTGTGGVTIAVIDPTDTTAPTVSITTPLDATEITEPTAFTAIVDNAGLIDWRLMVKAKGTAGEGIELASATGAQPGTISAQIDPTLLSNGQHTLYFEATDAASRTGQDAIAIRVTGENKVGHFSISFEDMSIPVAGIPVSVIRTYDSRRRGEALDFGQGWSVDYQSVRLQESRAPGAGWELTEERSGPFGAFVDFCVKPIGDNIVTVTLPDGQVDTFEVHAVPECNQFVPILDVQFDFQPIDGTDSTLQQTDVGPVRLINGNLGELAGEPIMDPNQYTLTTREGFVYSLDQSFGVRQIKDPNDNTLTYTDESITHSLGQQITFERDEQNRITRIIDPRGNSVDYSYSQNNDLIKMTDQVGAETRYTYFRDHLLNDIIDPRGIRVSRNLYDDDGRLIAIIDADGNRLDYTHDIEGRREEVRDRLGHLTVYTYDERGNVLVETNAEGETTTRTYDDDDNELTITDGLGNTTTMTYDASGNLLTETDPLGNTTTSAYNDKDQLLSLTDAKGNVVMTNTYSDSSNLLTTTDALGHTTTYTYTYFGAPETITDPLGNVTTFEYDNQGRKTKEIDARGTETTFTYDANDNETSTSTTRTDANGTVHTLTTTYTYDAANRLIVTTDPLGRTTRTVYNTFGQEAASIDAKGRRTEFSYDSRGNLTATTYPDGSSDSTSYDRKGNKTADIDRAGRSTTYAYDKVDRLTTTTAADGSTTQSEYDDAGRLNASIDARGNRTEYTYDAAGRRLQTKNALNQTTTVVYDELGQQTSITDARGNTTSFTYDAAGRRTQTTYADGTASTTTYDALGRKINQTDQAGKTTQFGFDETGSLITVTDALNQVTSFSYDEQNNKLTQTDANSHTTSWVYDNGSRVTGRTLPEGQTESFSYDATDNVLSKTDFNGATTTYAYNNLDQLNTIRYADNTSVETSYTITGQRDTVTDHRGTTTYRYDSRDRNTGISYPDGNDISYSYDAVSNRTAVTTPAGSTDYTYDALNRMETVSANNGTTTYHYDEVGNRAGIANSNGTSTEYVYDTLNRLTQLTNRDSSNAIIEQYDYTLAPAGQRTQVTESNGRVVDYSYDDTYKLLQEQVTDTTRGDRTTSFTYDSTGNRQSQTDNGETTTYSYDNNDRLTTEVKAGITTTYTYDNNGNTLTKVAGSETTTYTYDHENRLLTSSDGTDTSNYTYDADGIRQSKTEAGETTNFLIDPNRSYAQVLEERDGSNALKVVYTYGDDLISQSRSGNTSTYHYDGLGSTRALTDSTGNTLNSYHYSAFGDIEHQTGTAENDYLFTGEQYDPDLGFYYLRARYYDPSVGRFATMDTFAGVNSDPITLHKYLYGNGDPFNMVDPSGNISMGSIAAGLRGLISLTRASLPAFRGLANRAIKAPKWRFYKGKKTKRAKLRNGGLRFVPHFFIYAELLTRPGKGIRYDVSANNAGEFFDGIRKGGDLTAATNGFVVKENTTRIQMRLGGEKISKRPFVKLRHLQFIAWEQVAYVPFTAGFDYCIAGTNCASWTVTAIAEAKIASKLPVFP